MPVTDDDDDRLVRIRRRLPVFGRPPHAPAKLPTRSTQADRRPRLFKLPVLIMIETFVVGPKESRSCRCKMPKDLVVSVRRSPVKISSSFMIDG